MSRLLTLVTALAVAVAVAAIAAVPASARRIPGLPTGSSLLFSLDALDGTLTPVPGARARRERRYTLVLNRVERHVTWFTDRPDREAGRIPARRLFANWGALGFRRVPPNAALVVDGAHRSRDTMAVELRLRSYDPRRRTARFAVRALGGIGGGLDQLANRVDRRVAPRFGSASLFIDNASQAAGCALGQPQLFATTKNTMEGMVPADGRTLRIQQYTALFSIYGTRFGGDGIQTFQLPAMDAPTGMRWWICLSGFYPSGNYLGQCTLGEVDYWILTDFLREGAPPWAPADGRTIQAQDYPLYVNTFAAGQSPVTLPNVPAPEGMTALVCVDDNTGDSPALSQLDMFVGQPVAATGTWFQANGVQLQIAQNQALYALLGGTFGQTGGTAFALPRLAGPVPGLQYYLAARGYWPS